jgi:hypothetical protein
MLMMREQNVGAAEQKIQSRLLFVSSLFNKVKLGQMARQQKVWLIKWLVDQKTCWPNELDKWQGIKMSGWWNDLFTKWLVYQMTCWSNDLLTKWIFD